MQQAETMQVHRKLSWISGKVNEMNEWIAFQEG